MPVGPFGDLGPCEIEWNDTTITAIHEDGAEFNLTMGTADIKEGAFGASIVDKVATGYELCEVKAPFTRLTYANLQKLIPGSSVSGSYAVRGHGGNMVGTSLYDLSYELIVKRIVNGVADTTGHYWLHLFKTYPIPNFNIPFRFADGQRGFMVTFPAFPLQAASNMDAIGATWRIGGDK
jgi:hypothetical protein